MCCLKANQYMHVIRNAAYGFGNDAQGFGRAAEISVKTRTPGWFNKRTLVLGAKDDMGM